MPEYKWPEAGERTYIGKRISRVDGPEKVSGRAKYTYDVIRPNLLYGKIVRSPYAHCRIKSIDIAAAEKHPGVQAVMVVQKPGAEIQWEGDEVVALAAVDERTAEDAARLVKVEYEVLPPMVSDAEPPRSTAVSEGPLSEDDLFGMLDNQVPTEEMVAAINKNGLSFKPSADLIENLPKWGVPAPVIEAMKTAKVSEAPKGPQSPYKKAAAVTTGDPGAAFKQAAVTSEGTYGVPVITHCCLETHGAMSEYTGDNSLLVHISTQNVSGIAAQMAEPLGIPAGNIRVHQDHVGGGFGSKFGPDRWGVVSAQLSKLAGGKPVKIMLERDAELQVAGARPSAYARVRLAAAQDGTVTGWQSDSWATGGPGGGGMPPLPYVFNIPNQRKQHTAIATNQGPARAWRAPNHPQAAAITMCAMEDLAARLNMDPYDLFMKNLAITGPRAENYREELEIANKLMNWKERWHARGDKAAGPVKRGLGLSIHTWGGRGHESNCDLSIHPDGSVDIKMGTQDLGTGTRTAILMVAADTLGIPLEQIRLNIGDTQYPSSGGSGGSTTIGGVSSSTRRAAVDALYALFEKVAPGLNATADQLESRQGMIRVKGTPDRAIAWKQACAKLGVAPITVRGKNPDRSKPPDLTNSGVGGVQMADVSVDVETGIVKMNKFVCVQDCGLIIDLKTAESQVYGAMIMGITYALYEQKVLDPVTGRMLNPNMEFYRLAGIGDIGELVVHMMTGKGYDERGVIGLGEPPVVSPGAAISNAVANALGVRVPFLPLTPQNVLNALQNAKKGGRA